MAQINFTQSYFDLCDEILVLEIRIQDLEREKKFLRKGMYSNAPKGAATVDYSAERVTGGQVPLTLDKILERLNKIDDQIILNKEVLNAKHDARKKIEDIISKFDGLDYQVAYMRDVKRMRLQEIADELGYSYDWIRKVSSRIKKAHSRHKTVDNL
jgi:hypothetical protein